MLGRGFRIGLSQKILAIGAVGTAGLLVVAAVYFLGARSIASYQKTSDEAAAMNAIMDKVVTELLRMRQAEKNFLIQGIARFSDRHHDFAVTTRQDIAALKGKLSAAGLPDLVSKTETVSGLFESYVKNFEILVAAKLSLGSDPKSGIEGRLQASVGAIESELDKFDDMRLLSLVLSLRHHEKDFKLNRDPKYVEEMKKTAAEMAVAIRIATIPPRTKEVFGEKLAAYQRDFAAYVESSELVNRARTDMLEAYNKVEPALEVVEKAVQAINTEARAAADSTRDATTLRIQLALLIIILGVGILSFLIGRSVSKPLAAMKIAMGKLGAGDFDVVLPGLGRKDEIGDIATAVESFKVSAMEKAKSEADEVLRRQAADAKLQAAAAEERARLAAEQERVVESLAQALKSLSAGDLTHRLGDDFPAAYRQVRDDFNTAIAGLQDTISAIAGATREVTGAAAEISTGTTDLSQRTEEQAASLEETSASMEQMSSTVKKNAQNAEQADQFTRSTSEVGNRAGEVVADAVGAMSRIEQSSRKISDIISVIDEIARQTNLLALNAAVEAARAGEAGRGFAVVASEVRSLAQRSSQAAKDIKELITGSSTQVQEGVDLVNRAGASLNEMIVSIKKISDIVSEISSASSEQAAGIDQINKALSQMDEVTQQNSALVEQNAASAKTLEEQAVAMGQRVSFFRVDAAKSARSPAVASPQVVAMAPQRPAAAVSKPAPASKRPEAAPQRRPARAQAALAIENDWKEF